MAKGGIRLPFTGGFPGNVPRAIVGLERFSEGKSVPAEYWVMEQVSLETD
jgi:hypothetical protein